MLYVIFVIDERKDGFLMKQGVIGIVRDEESNQIILVKRRDIPIWVLPGGGIDLGETPEDAVVREILEETGLTAVIVRKTAEYFPLNKLCSLTHVYECKPVGGELKLTDETRAIRSFPSNDLPKSFLFVHKDWLDDANKSFPYVIKAPITQVTYWELAKFFLFHPVVVFRALLARFGCPLNTK